MQSSLKCQVHLNLVPKEVIKISASKSLQHLLETQKKEHF